MILVILREETKVKKFMRPCAIFLSVVMFFEYDGLRRICGNRTKGDGRK